MYSRANKELVNRMIILLLTIFIVSGDIVMGLRFGIAYLADQPEGLIGWHGAVISLAFALFLASIYLSVSAFRNNRRRIGYFFPSLYSEGAVLVIVLSFSMVYKVSTELASPEIGNTALYSTILPLFGASTVLAITAALLKTGISDSGVVGLVRLYPWSDVSGHGFDREKKEVRFQIKGKDIKFDYNPQDEQTIESLIRRYRDGEDAELSTS